MPENNTPEVAVKTPNQETTQAAPAATTTPSPEPQTPAPAVAEEPKAPTIGEALIKPSTPKPTTVPFEVAMEWKRERNEARDKLREAQPQPTPAPAPAAPISEDIEEIAAQLEREYRLDPQLVRKLTTGISASTRKGIEAEMRAVMDAELAPFRESRQREAAADTKRQFDSLLANALQSRPELVDVADPETLFQLALLPANADKTMEQLVEQVYGKARTASAPRETIETSRPTRGDSPVDFSKVGSDSALMAQVMADPALKKKYKEYQLEILSGANRRY